MNKVFMTCANKMLMLYKLYFKMTHLFNSFTRMY